MSEILSKAQRSAAIVTDNSIEPWRRVSKALTALSGVSISSLSVSAREVLELELGNVNKITAEYEIATDDDYATVDDADLTEILQRIETVAKALIDSETQRVMSGLREISNRLPRVEIEEVRQHQDVFVPLLIEAIEHAVASARAGDKPDGDTHFFAAFLLTELEIDPAFPLLLDGFLLRGEGGFDLFGDAVHELLPSALALFWRDTPGKIDEMVQDADIEMYIRWSAASAYIHLVRDGAISRDTAVANLHEHLMQFMARRDHELIAPIICKLSELAASEALETIREAYDQGLVDEFIVGLDSVESQIADGDDTVRKSLERCRPTGMPDTIAELSHWAAFRQKPSGPAKYPVPRDLVPEPISEPSDFTRSEPPATLRTDKAKIGRNAPCPCGSGKKFKRCCRQSHRTIGSDSQRHPG